MPEFEAVCQVLYYYSTLSNRIWKKRSFFSTLANKMGFEVANCPSCFICSAKKLWISDEIMSTGMFKHFRSNV